MPRRPTGADSPRPRRRCSSSPTAGTPPGRLPGSSEAAAAGGKLDRLGRNLAHLVNAVQDLAAHVCFHRNTGLEDTEILAVGSHRTVAEHPQSPGKCGRIQGGRQDAAFRATIEAPS